MNSFDVKQLNLIGKKVQANYLRRVNISKLNNYT